MIEEGLVRLIKSSAAVLALAPVGGNLSQVPKGNALPTWTYMVVSGTSGHTLDGLIGLLMDRVQIDCYGRPDPKLGPADVVKLAHAIDAVLDGYSGVLTDGASPTGSTRVFGCFREDKGDFFDSESKSYRRMLEYEIYYTQV